MNITFDTKQHLTAPILQLDPEISRIVFSFVRPSDILKGINLTCKPWSRLVADQILWNMVALRALKEPFSKQDREIVEEFFDEKTHITLLCSAAVEGSKLAQNWLLERLDALEKTQDTCKLFKELADQGNPWAQYCLGKIYLKFGIEYQNRGMCLLQSAMQKGVLEAKFLYARQTSYYYGSPTYQEILEKFRKKGLPTFSDEGELIEELASQNFIPARIYLYIHQNFGEDFFEKAIKEENGDLLFFYSTNPFITDPQQKLKLLQKAMNLGHIKAGFLLALTMTRDNRKFEELENALPPPLCYQMGVRCATGRNRDYYLEQYDSIVLSNQVEELPALYCLMHLQGKILEQSEVKAFFYFKKVISSGLDLKCDNRGLLDLLEKLDQAINSNPSFCQKIFDYYTRKAQEGKGYYQFRLGDLYEKGRYGQEKNIEKALEFYEKASQNDDLEASYRLCKIYAFEKYNQKFNAEKVLETFARVYELSDRADRLLKKISKKCSDQDLIEKLKVIVG